MVLTGPVTIYLIVIFFSKELQGFYYTFFSLIAFKLFIDLGLSNIAVQFASHEWSRLKFDEQGNVCGKEEDINRLAAIGRYIFKWFLTGTVFYIVSLLFLGYFFFKNKGYDVDWLGPWIAVCIISGLEVITMPALSLLKGCDRIEKVYQFQFYDSLISRLGSWIIIIYGGGLWAVVGYMFGNLMISLSLCISERKFFSVFFRKVQLTSELGSEIKQMQLRIGLSSICGFFTFSLLNPIAFHFLGAVTAGQLGLTINVITMLMSIVYIWINVKVPEFGKLIAKRNFKKLDEVFFRTYKIFTTLLFAASLLFIAFFLILTQYREIEFVAKILDRFLDLHSLTLFTVGSGASALFLPFSIYLRCHKKEPLLMLSFLSSVFMLSALLLSAAFFKIQEMALAYCLIHILTAPFIIKIWINCRNKWHLKEA